MNRHHIRRIDALAGKLIRRAARNTPPSLSQRLEEEWLADMATRRGQITRLRLAVGCWWAARVIAHERAFECLAPAGSPGGHQVATAYAPHDSSFLSRRTIALLVIASLHAGLIYLLAIGFVHQVIEVPPSVIRANVAEDAQPPQLPPPPPKFSGRSLMRSVSMTVLCSADSVLSVPASAVTVTVSVAAPTSSVASTRAVAAT